MLRVEKLRIGALPSLSFAVADGECLAVEGPSGSGKTRILRAIADLDPNEGQLFLDGIERREMPATEWRKHVRYAAAEPGWWADTPRQTLPTTEFVDARAILDEPRVLLLDEPTAALDAGATAMVEELIRFQLQAGRSVLIASHDTQLIDRLAHVRLQLAPTVRAHPAGVASHGGSTA